MPKTQLRECNLEEVAVTTQGKSLWMWRLQVLFFPPFSFFLPLLPTPQKEGRLRELWQMSPLQGNATQPCLFCCGGFCGREAAYPTLSSMFVNIWFSQKTKKGKSSGIQQKVRTAIFLPGPASFYTLTSGAHYQNK